MPTLEGSVLVKGTPEALFWFSQDYDQRLVWDKYLGVARLEHGATQAAKGVEAYCESRKGIGMTVRYISFHPPTQVAMEMTKGPWLFRKFSGSWRFKPEKEELTRVYFRYNFQVRFAGLILNPFINWLLHADIKNRLKYFKEAVEAGVLQA
ncbi:type II toxin-antitoxin system RatA family toxin [Rufibacter hautae]|uniref:SRPBCC family protein n=1 Tax=Rufibacter hautae TaxID=2595005 RepID=A0A5B6TG90_9BACT|nr:SRPBCC family protein [Rufibacter hautae]KAA3438272.1 SRPBCC family protein [Rufibacter hautae]